MERQREREIRDDWIKSDFERRKEMERQREREKTLYVPPPPPPPPPPVAEQVGGFTKVNVCSSRVGIRSIHVDCKRAGPVLTCPEFKACYRKNKRGPCDNDELYKKCGCRGGSGVDYCG